MIISKSPRQIRSFLQFNIIHLLGISHPHGPADVLCDNQSVTKNVELPQSAQSKSHDEICYHRVHKAQTAYVVRVGWIQGEYNQADLGTNTTLSTKRRYKLVNKIMWNDGFTILK